MTWDVTEGDRAEDEQGRLRRRIAELEAEVRRYRTTPYSIGDAVISTEATGAVLQMKRVAETLTGWPENEAQGRPLEEVCKLIDEETRAAVANPIERVLHDGNVLGLANHTLLITRSAAEVPIATSGAPIRDARGQTTKEIGKGTGLGLSTVYGTVKQSGGGICVRSEVGQGTTFDIYLPRTTAAVPSKGEPPVAAGRPASGVETVLLVEDETAFREAVRRSLLEEGYTVLTVADGEEALRIAGEHPGEIHLLLTDVIMPRLGGRGLAHELRKVRPEVKVLYMSGYSHETGASAQTSAAPANFIGKPFSAADLTQKARAVLDGQILASPREAPIDKAASDTNGALLEGVPGEVLARLGHAAQSARYDEIVALVATLRGSHPELATRLAALAEAFDYAGMRRLLQR